MTQLQFGILILLVIDVINFMITDYRLDKIGEKIDKLLEEKKGLV